MLQKIALILHFVRALRLRVAGIATPQPSAASEQQSAAWLGLRRMWGYATVGQCVGVNSSPATETVMWMAELEEKRAT